MQKFPFFVWKNIFIDLLLMLILLKIPAIWFVWGDKICKRNSAIFLLLSSFPVSLLAGIQFWTVSHFKDIWKIVASTLEFNANIQLENSPKHRLTFISFSSSANFLKTFSVSVSVVRQFKSIWFQLKFISVMWFDHSVLFTNWLWYFLSNFSSVTLLSVALSMIDNFISFQNDAY